MDQKKNTHTHKNRYTHKYIKILQFFSTSFILKSLHDILIIHIASYITFKILVQIIIIIII